MATITEQNPSVVFVARAASDDATRYFMTGLHVEDDDGTRKIIATDGRRIHIDNYHGDLEPMEANKSCYRVVRSSMKKVKRRGIRAL